MHQATLDLQKAMQKMKKSYREYYILKMDVRKFFNSIDKKILYKILKKRIKDEKLLWLIRQILSAQERQKGIEIGKSVTGIFTGKFENISQAQNAIKNGGIIDGISDVIDSTLNFTSKKGMIPSNVTTLIRKGKNAILDNISSNIETEFANQINNVEKLGKYENNWREFYKSQNFEGMEREYQKIKDKLKQTLPLEETLKQARQIENLHLIIKNNGQDFNLTEEQKKLAEILIK